MRTKFWSENVNGGNHLRDLRVHGKIILKLILNYSVCGQGSRRLG